VRQFSGALAGNQIQRQMPRRGFSRNFFASISSPVFDQWVLSVSAKPLANVGKPVFNVPK
jgi:hypothetical protein